MSGVGFMPLILVAGYVLMERLGVALPPPTLRWSTLPWSTLPMLVAVFTLGAVGEELGWTAFATERLRGRYSVPAVGVVLGTAWALWHVVPFVQTGHDWAWIVWQCLFTVAFRLLLVQLYMASNRSLAIPVLAHAGYNVAWAMSPVGAPPTVRRLRRRSPRSRRVSLPGRARAGHRTGRSQPE